MKTLHVDLGNRSYPIFIGQDLLGKAEFLTPYLNNRQVLIVTNETIAPLYLDKVLSAFAGYQTATAILPDGEEYKNLVVLNQIFDSLLSNRFDRRCTLVALGGGVIGDMTGFAAAAYQRGVAFIQIPTTLLAQVDSSVGGKTGVNHALGKNMIGAFHQPQCVLVDTDSLLTLDDRQFSAGLAEVVKYGLINDDEFFAWIEHNAAALLARDPVALNFAISRSCQNKANIVAQDELENGLRALLNLGHTFGHAIETGCGYGEYLHGEAVAIGTCLATRLSAHLKWLQPAAVERIFRLFDTLHLPTAVPPELTVEQMIAAMQVDKKARDGKINLVLLYGIGKAVLTDQYDVNLFQQTLKEGYATVP